MECVSLVRIIGIILTLIISGCADPIGTIAFPITTASWGYTCHGVNNHFGSCK
jgi:hypothetical protein